MPDGQPLFSAAHGNLLPAAALTAESLATASAALAGQTADGVALHLTPRFLLVGTANGATARELAVKQTPPTGAQTVGALTVVRDNRIPGKGWYLTTDPRERPTFVTAHLAATGGPELLVKDGWEIDAREYKARDAFGVAAVDPRGALVLPTQLPHRCGRRPSSPPRRARG